MTLIEPGTAILVTGATGSIGFEIAAQAAGAGAIVGVHGSSSDSVARAIDRLKVRVPDAHLIAAPGDFRDPVAIDAVVGKFVQEAGSLNALIHCAVAGSGGGGRVTGPFRDTDPASYGPTAQTMLGVLEQLSWTALPHLSRGGGTIVAFSSDAGRFAAPRQSVLGAIYAGIIAFVRNLAVETARDGVRVHCISPSFVAETRIFERMMSSNGRAGSASDRAGLGLPTPSDIAPMALFLCGPGAARITGQVISINGGMNA